MLHGSKAEMVDIEAFLSLLTRAYHWDFHLFLQFGDFCSQFDLGQRVSAWIHGRNFAHMFCSPALKHQKLAREVSFLVGACSMDHQGVVS